MFIHLGKMLFKICQRENGQTLYSVVFQTAKDYYVLIFVSPAIYLLCIRKLVKAFVTVF